MSMKRSSQLGLRVELYYRNEIESIPAYVKAPFVGRYDIMCNETFPV